ncbi:MAG: UTP--glucose-1-phosphate uridylyltransferase [Actinobacteria bacterium]|nr:MAG: UTP--glucose-1-phosphate uridylyltransferase [Actinomycetota bacterium]
MRRDGVAELAIRTFADFYERLVAGEQGMLPEDEIEPVEDVPDADALPEPDADGRAALDRAIVLKLNGGLGTSMGMTRAKSLLEVKDGLSFLDVIARAVLQARERHGVRLPLVLMNSFYTRDDSLRALDRYPELGADVPLDFVQDKVPKLRADDLTPVTWPDDPELEWAPPGHGDLYTALVVSGMLEQLLERGYEYAFVSNADNLGAVLEPRILAWFAREQLPFAMEVADRTEADRKGGHLARRRDGGLVLRETAQTPDEDLDAFQDVARHRFFNTNNLWVNLRTLDEAMRERDGVLGLPMIVNRKTVDPGDPDSPAVIQLESAMGAAIGVFEGTRALRVSRRRFAPVKTTSDLLALRSDAYVLTPESNVELAAERDGTPPFVDLDSRFYKLVRDFEARFAAGAPSLVACERLAVAGDVAFGRGVVVRGSVRVEHDGDGQLRIEDGAVLEM